MWFPLRKGLLRELMGGKPQWVRAVDGVDFDIRRGEVFCLVGESGCGKTTTGKAILKLVDATEGDVLIETPEGEVQAYEEARRRPHDAASRRRLDGIRRTYSVTWKETLPWGLRQIAISVAVILAATVLALFVPSAALAFLGEPFSDPWSTLGSCFAVGGILGLVAPLPPTRPWRRMPHLGSLLAIGVIAFLSVPSVYFRNVVRGAGLPFDLGSAFALAWQHQTGAMIAGLLFGAAMAAGISALIIGWRQRSEGLAGMRMRSIRRRLQLIFQDPYESLNPKQSVYEIVSEPLRVNRIVTNPGEMSAVVRDALAEVGLRPPEEFLFRFPHELSGGQRQRVSIAAALVLRPDFIVADEPVSMLDVSIRTEILQLMMDLRKSRGITFLFITHDLGLAWVLADRVAVMYLGKIVESGTAAQVIGRPMHPYTQALISVVPSPDPRHKVERVILKGERPDPVDIPAGCRFHPRCPFAFEKCGWSASEVAEQLQALKTSGVLPGVEAIEVIDSEAVRLSPAGGDAGALAGYLGGLVASRRDQDLPLRGIADVRPANGQVEATLHLGSEPELVEIGPGNAVACHLVPAGEAVQESVTA